MAGKILTGGQEIFGEWSAHVVTRVFCQQDGVICYERDGAPAILLASSPRASREEAQARCIALLGMAGEPGRMPNDFEMNITISSSGHGLTYKQLFDQTRAMLAQSIENEHRSKDKTVSKCRKYREARKYIPQVKSQ